MERFGVPRKIVSFVIPLGYSFNLDGTTLYLSMASIFVAQASGIDALMDMGRTSINVIGNGLASAVIARWEKEL